MNGLEEFHLLWLWPPAVEVEVDVFFHQLFFHLRITGLDMGRAHVPASGIDGRIKVSENKNYL